MSIVPLRQPHPSPTLLRFSALAPLDLACGRAVEAAVSRAVTIPARRELVTESRTPGEAKIITEGWAARVRIQLDGRRQFLSFLLPGDLIGMCAQPDPLATSTAIALTALKLCPAPSPDEAPALGAVYAMSKALEEAYLLDHIGRLGHLTAQERILHLLLELDERLALSGMAKAGSFDMPLTQEQLADALGLTPVHVNRMLQQARREVGLIWRGRKVSITNPTRLGERIGRIPVRVSETM